MSPATSEIVRIFEALPEHSRIEILEFARFLREMTENPDDAAWERILADPTPRPKLEAFMEQANAEGGDEPLDLNRL
jgi:hypothetical protein